MESTIRAAVDFINQGGKAPPSSDVVTALKAAEKESKREKQQYSYENLLGTWQLGFVSGTKTKKTAGKPIKTLGNGRFLPRFIAIAITYTQHATADANRESNGTAENAVTLGPLKLKLTGPTHFWRKTNSLAFDFTALQANLGALPLYDGAMRGGAKRDETFQTQPLKNQAFFTFFIVQPNYIAARGKGGGLALWVRQQPEYSSP